MAKLYRVDLSDKERDFLLGLIQKGTASARTFRRAHVLLLADEGKTDQEIAEALHIGASTVHRTRQRFVEGGTGMSVERRPPARGVQEVG